MTNRLDDLPDRLIRSTPPIHSGLEHDHGGIEDPVDLVELDPNRERSQASKVDDGLPNRASNTSFDSCGSDRDSTEQVWLVLVS